MHAELSKRVCDVSQENEREPLRRRSRSRSEEVKSRKRRHSSSRDCPPSTEITAVSPQSPAPPIRASLESPVAVVKVPMLVSSELEEGEEIE